MTPFQGVFPAVPTPFSKGGETFDEPAMRGQIKYLIEKGVHGLFITGATGEGPSIPPDERKRVIDVVADENANQTCLIAQIGCNTVPETIEIAKHAAKVKLGGAAVLIPPFYLCDGAAVVEFFLPIAEALGDVPLFFYNIPARTGNDLPFDAVAELKERCSNVSGIKESGTLTNLAKWMELQDDRFRVYCGMDPHEYDAYLLGSRAIVASFANWLPETFVAFHEAACAGRWEEARKLQNQIIKTITPGINENVFANIKTGLRMKGVTAGYVRKPLRDLTGDEEEALRQKLIANGFLQS